MTRPAPPFWLAPVVVWIALLALLGLNTALAFAPLGALRTGVNLGVSALQAVLIAIVLMRLDKASGLIRIAAAAGVLWATFLFVLAGADYLTRS